MCLLIALLRKLLEGVLHQEQERNQERRACPRQRVGRPRGSTCASGIEGSVFQKKLGENLMVGLKAWRGELVLHYLSNNQIKSKAITNSREKGIYFKTQSHSLLHVLTN